ASTYGTKTAASVCAQGLFVKEGSIQDLKAQKTWREPRGTSVFIRQSPGAPFLAAFARSGAFHQRPCATCTAIPSSVGWHGTGTVGCGAVIGLTNEPGSTHAEGAPSFAQFAKGGNEGRIRNGICAEGNKLCPAASLPALAKNARTGTLSCELSRQVSREGWATRRDSGSSTVQQARGAPVARHLPQRLPGRASSRILLDFVQLLIDQHGDEHQQKYSRSDAEYAHREGQALHFGQQFRLLGVHVRTGVIQKQLLVLVHGQRALVDQQDDQTDCEHSEDHRHDSQRHKPPRYDSSPSAGGVPQCLGFEGSWLKATNLARPQNGATALWRARVQVRSIQS